MESIGGPPNSNPSEQDFKEKEKMSSMPDKSNEARLDIQELMRIRVIAFLLTFTAAIFLLYQMFFQYWSVLYPEEKIFAILAVIAAFVGSILVALSFHLVQDYERGVVLFLGKHKPSVLHYILPGVRGPGLVVVLPILERMILVDIRDDFRHFKDAMSQSKDQVPLKGEGVVFFQVVDPVKAVLRVQGDYRHAVREAAETELREEMGTFKAAEVISNRHKIAQQTKDRLEDLVLERYGIAVVRINFTDVVIRDPDIQHSFANAAQAEIDAQARLRLAEIEMQISTAMDEASAVYQDNDIAFGLRQMSLIAEMVEKKGEGSTIVLPSELSGFFRQLGIDTK